MTSYLADGTKVSFDLETGDLASYRLPSGEEFLSTSVRGTFVRGPTDNDLMLRLSGSFAEDWIRMGLKHLKLTCNTLGTGITVKHFLGTEFEALWTRHTTVEGKVLSFTHEVRVFGSFETLPRIGENFQVDPSFDVLTWFGRGPWENYPDRKSAALVGRYQQRISTEVCPYLTPGEWGARQDVRWFRLCREDGSGVQISGTPSFGFSALKLGIHVDGQHLGVGGNTGWSRNVQPAFHVPPGTYRWATTWTSVPKE